MQALVQKKVIDSKYRSAFELRIFGILVYQYQEIDLTSSDNEDEETD